MIHLQIESLFRGVSVLLPCVITAGILEFLNFCIFEDLGFCMSGFGIFRPQNCVISMWESGVRASDDLRREGREAREAREATVIHVVRLPSWSSVLWIEEKIPGFQV